MTEPGFKQSRRAMVPARGTNFRRVHWCVEAASQQECEMDEQTPQPNAAARALDTVTDVMRTTTEISSALVDAVGRLIEALERARRPHRPLGIVAAMTREAPLSALFVAVLLGIAIGRRH
jgi:hypothetical protein